jgi:hypothetical protein
MSQFNPIIHDQVKEEVGRYLMHDSFDLFDM